MKFCVDRRASMDFKTAVYNAARDGNLTRLKVYLHTWRTAQELNMLVGAKTGGATPLVIACRNGHYDVAEYLIDRCKADVEQPGSVTFDGETIEGAPPLWCAAAAGHLPLVRLLMKAGARVNSTTRTNSTPLRAACFDGHIEIVRYLIDNGADIEIANRHGHTCLMIACYRGHIRIVRYLLSLKADVNRKSVKGNTALHDCAESGSLHILKLLLEHGAAMDVDSYGMTPLLAASVTGHQHIVEHLVNLKGGGVTRQQRIDALELLGATYVDKRRDMVGALWLWKRAMDQRYPADGSTVIPKPTGIPLVEAYDYTVEESDPEKLDELLANPDAMRMQALIIRERILGPAHPDTSYYVRYRGAVYADAGRFARCRQLWHHALDMQQAMLEPLSLMTQSSLYSFAELFTFMLNERSRPPSRSRVIPPVMFEDIIPVFEKAIAEIQRGLHLLESKTADRDQLIAVLHRNLVIGLHLAALMARLLEEQDCDKEVSKSIHKAVYNLVKMNVKVKSGREALHVTCTGEVARGAVSLAGANAASLQSTALSPHSCPQALVRLLLRVGADPNGRDADGNTPLHLAAKLNPCPAEVVLELLNNGAHFDTVNYDCETFSDILKQSGQNVRTIVNPLKFISLKCLAARAVKHYKLPYRNQIPRSLHGTVITH